MGLLGSITGGYGEKDQKSTKQSDYWTPEQKEASQRLFSGVIEPGFTNYSSTYTGKPTDIEQMGLSKLKQFTGTTPQYMNQSSEALSRALTGQGYSDIIDPKAAEQLYSAIQDRTLTQILPDVMTAAANEANIGGMLRSGTGQQLVTDEIGNITSQLSEMLASLQYSDEQQRRDIEMERERRQLQAIPQTSTLQANELGRLTPALQYGGMTRDIAGTQYSNPLTQLVLAYLGLRGQENTQTTGSQTGWDISGKLGGSIL